MPAPTFSTAGPLPANVTLSSGGLLSGVPLVSLGGQSFPFTLTATNGVAPDASQSFTLRINRRPVGGTVSLATSPNTPGSVAVAKLRSASTDPDGDALTISGVSASSAQGGTVVLSGTAATYTPPTNYSGPDSFTFTVTDGFAGSTGTGTVNVSVRGAGALSLNIVSITTTGAGTTIVAQGIPGLNYIIQFSDNMQATWANLSGPITAGSNGRIEYLDATQPPPTQRFYRAISAP